MKGNSKLFFLFFLYVGISAVSSAQSDSILADLKQTKNINMRALKAYDYAKGHFRSHPKEVCKEFLFLNNNQDEISDSALGNVMNVLGILYQDKHLLDSSTQFFSSAQEIAGRTGDSTLFLKTVSNLAINLRYLGRYDSAIAQYHKALAIYEAWGDEAAKGRIFTELGNIHLLLKKPALGETYFRKAIRNFEIHGDEVGRANAFGSIGFMYVNAKLYDSAMHYYQMAFNIHTAQNNLIGQAGSKASMCGLLRELGGTKREELDCLLDLLEFHKKTNDKQALAMNYLNIGRCYNFLNQYQKALKYELLAFPIIHELNYPFLKRDLYDDLSETYYKLGDYKKSRAYLLQHIQVKDSLNSVEKTKDVADIEAKYQTEKKEQENIALKQQSDIKELRINRLLLALLASILILIVVFFIYQNRIKKQRLKFKDELITSNLLSEEKEKKRIARELHDDVGQQISSIQLGIEHLEQNENLRSEELSDIKKMVGEALISVRGLSHQMMPIALQRFGWIKAVESLCDYLNETSEIEFVFENFNVKTFTIPEDTQVHLYRIVQELCSNIIKHSKANHAEIQLFKKQDRYHVYVFDDGIGLKVGHRTNDGIGLMNIRSRAKAFNGEVKIPDEEEGTTFQIIV